jgi:hypothetical protein
LQLPTRVFLCWLAYPDKSSIFEQGWSTCTIAYNIILPARNDLAYYGKSL